MDIIIKKQIIAMDAVNAWKKAGKRGTFEMATGSGKTFAAFHAICSMPEQSRILFLYEATDRYDTLQEELDKYFDVYGVDLREEYILTFWTYQKAYKILNNCFELVIADEIHESLTPIYSLFYTNNFYDSILGLSATIDRNIKYENGYTKGEYLDAIAPVCYTYNLQQARDDKNMRDLKIYYIRHYLDDINKTVKSGTKTNPFYTTEYKYYKYWDKKVIQGYYIGKEQNDYVLKHAIKRRTDALYNLKSKEEAVKKLINGLSEKTLIYANSLDFLLNITKNVVSSRNKHLENQLLISKFENGKIPLLGSYKKLEQGINLSKLHNVILASYYGKTKNFVQRVGRLRKEGDKHGNVFIFVTQGTQEEVWFKKMFELDTDDIIYCNNVEDCISKLKENGE